MEAEQSYDYPPQQRVPGTSSDFEGGIQLIKVLTEHEDILDLIKMQLRGEQVYQDKDGKRYMVQVDKPEFVLLDEYNKPMKRKNENTGKEEFVPNDEAINEVISTLKFCGLNPVAPMTTIDENEIRADLLEMESKIAVLLANKRKKWGIDKAAYPNIVGKIKILIKDARYRSLDGIPLKALRTITSRLEQSQEQRTKPTIMQRIKSPFAAQ